MKRFLPIVVLLFAIGFYAVTEHVSPTKVAASGERKAIQFWCTALPAQVISEFTQRFEQLHPEYKVEIQTVAWNSLQEKTLWAVAAESNVPDLILGSSEWTG